jgi:hypothetical protein
VRVRRDQRFGLTRKHDRAGSTGRAGQLEDEKRLAFLFRMSGSLFVAVSNTGGTSSPGKAKYRQYSRPNTRVKHNNRI